MKVAIHQPNLFPWLGFFQKIEQADVFVFLDHTINNPKESIYTKRVQVMSNKAAHWLTIPLEASKEKTYIPISEMKIHTAMLQLKKVFKLFEYAYSKTPFYEEIMPEVKAFFEHESTFIAERNMDFVQRICGQLNIDTPLSRSSDLNIESSSNELLIDITKRKGGSCYLSGDGADGYQKPAIFQNAGISLEFLNFKHPTYQQNHKGEFIKGLSIIDALMNVGFQGVEALIKKPVPQDETSAF